MNPRPLVLFTDRTDLDPHPGRALLAEAGCDTILADLPTAPGGEAVLPPGAARAVALVVGFARIDAGLLDRLPAVEFIATMSAGLDMIDLAATTARGIRVVNLTDAATEEVATHALALTLALERRLREGMRVVADGGWTDDVVAVPRRLSDLTLGLYGFGRIGRRFAEIARPSFGRILAHDPAAAAQVEGVAFVGRDALVAEADVLSLHVPSTPATVGVVNERLLSAMRPGATLVNVSRGDLVDGAALVAALDAGRLGGAALDVLPVEPPSPADPLRRHARVLVTPHTAFLSDRSLERYTLDPARNVLEWLRFRRSSD
jgi:D-3-phosphoglycerate dehydrogenase